ncbi:MAG: element excision factor XisH family protein [Bacteroidota bacterium]
MRDKIHSVIRTAFEKDGWVVQRDPFRFPLENVEVEIDLAVAKLANLIKEEDIILVEVKSFPNQDKSVIYDFYQAYGQYDFYRFWMDNKLPNKEIYLAVSSKTYHKLQAVGAIRAFIQAKKINFVVVSIKSEKIVEWLKH